METWCYRMLTMQLIFTHCRKHGFYKLWGYVSRDVWCSRLHRIYYGQISTEHSETGEWWLGSKGNAHVNIIVVTPACLKASLPTQVVTRNLYEDYNQLPPWKTLRVYKPPHPPFFFSYTPLLQTIHATRSLNYTSRSKVTWPPVEARPLSIPAQCQKLHIKKDLSHCFRMRTVTKLSL